MIGARRFACNVCGRPTRAGFGAYVVVPPTAVVLRARLHGLDAGSACLLLVLTLVSMATTVTVLVGALSVAYRYVMSDF
ncbi:MAG: hypothetical protein Q8K79_08400 [Solirubrobacteraceae bacterium]|nr:hypothetical protein [Solirubrobacteraceae bacterium]